MKYFFIHTPKTSGTTFMEVLRKDEDNKVGFFYPPRPDMDDFEKRVKEGPLYNLGKNPDWEKFNFIGGHFTFGIHQVLQAKEFKYVGVVREPVSHYISCCRAFLRMSEEYKDYLLPGSKGVEDMLSLEFTHNMQTFFLSGLSIQEIKNDKERAFQTVIENFEKHFAGIYPTEYFNEGLFYFKHKIGIKPINYAKKNVAKNFVGHEITAEIIEKVRAANDVDIRVYQYFSKRFKTELGQIPFISYQLKYFEAVNTIYRWLGKDN